MTGLPDARAHLDSKLVKSQVLALQKLCFLGPATHSHQPSPSCLQFFLSMFLSKISNRTLKNSRDSFHDDQILSVDRMSPRELPI